MFARLRGSAVLLLVAAGVVGILAGLLVLATARPQLGLALVAVGGCFLGFIRRRLAWACALVAAAGLAVAALGLPLAGGTAQYPLPIMSRITLIGLVLAFGGCYLGALASWIVAPGRGSGRR